MTVKIGDFGLSEYVNPDVQKDLSISGTPNYLARKYPRVSVWLFALAETLMKIGRSFPTDIWAIGCILYTLLVGKTPFDASTVQVWSEDLKTPYSCFRRPVQRSLAVSMLFRRMSIRTRAL